MGATRRIVIPDASWHPLLVVAAIGAGIIGVAVVVQVVQLIVSIRNRKELAINASDPWNGRTLEWSTPSPAPEYNFAVIPTIDGRDAYYMHKQKQAGQTALSLSGATSGVEGAQTPDVRSSDHSPTYTDIHMPRPTPMGILIAVITFLVGFALVWHIWWLLILSLPAILVSIIIRTFDENTEYVITDAEVAKIEAIRSR
jgi:cytochrome o ubiquinol oxidase subunit 1